MALDNFFRFVSDFKSVASLIGKAAVIAPFLGLLLNIGPPWPSGTGVPTLTAVAEVFVLIYAFQFYPSLGKRRLEKRLRLFFILVTVCFVLYISLYSFFVYDVPLTNSREVRGFIVRDEVQKIISPQHTIEYWLESAQWDEFRIWEAWTIQTTRTSLLLSWILFFVSLAGCIAIFVLMQQKFGAPKARTTKRVAKT